MFATRCFLCAVSTAHRLLLLHFVNTLCEMRNFQEGGSLGDAHLSICEECRTGSCILPLPSVPSRGPLGHSEDQFPVDGGREEYEAQVYNGCLCEYLVAMEFRS